MPEKTKACFSIGLTPSDHLRWRRMCKRKDVYHTAAVRDLVLEKLRKEKEPYVKTGTDIEKELAKFQAK